jgi:hypothetical protein
MGAGFLKQGFVNVMATRAFQDSTTRGLDSTDGSMFDQCADNGVRSAKFENPSFEDAAV